MLRESFCNAEIPQKMPRITRRFRLDLTLGLNTKPNGTEKTYSPLDVLSQAQRFAQIVGRKRKI